MTSLDLGAVDVLPLPTPTQWRVRQVVFQRHTGQVDDEGDPVVEPVFYSMVEMITVCGTNITFWSGDDAVGLANQLLRLAKLNKKGIPDRDTGPTPTGSQIG